MQNVRALPQPSQGLLVDTGAPRCTESRITLLPRPPPLDASISPTSEHRRPVCSSALQLQEHTLLLSALEPLCSLWHPFKALPTGQIIYPTPTAKVLLTRRRLMGNTPGQGPSGVTYNVQLEKNGLDPGASQSMNFDGIFLEI